VKYFAGIDGGQSATVAVVADETGRALAHGSGGAADEIGEPRSSTRLRDALETAIAQALRTAGLPADTRFESIVAGVSGYEGRIYGASPQLPTKNLTLLHDAPVAHAGAFAGEPGIVVIAGTGSVAYGTDDRGNAVTVGGWGFLFGDEGGAFWLAAQAMAAAMRAQDAEKEDRLAARALRYFREESLRKIARAFYANEISRAALAGFAREVLDAAEQNDEDAVRLLQSAAAALTALARRAHDRLEGRETRVAFTGGLLRSTALKNEVRRAMRALAPACTIAEPRYDAATGALLLAYRAAGRHPASIELSA